MSSESASPSPFYTTNPVVFFDIGLGAHAIGRIKFELFADVVPRTAENFRCLCTGEVREKGVPQGFKGCGFFRLIPGFMVQAGDFLKGDGTGSWSIYGPAFEDESFELRHSGPGLLSMANSGPNSNGCQFFVTFDAAPHLDGKHVVFGRVVEGLSILRTIEKVPRSPDDAPKIPVTVLECGQL